ncbi:MAG: 4-(cytidine 5'-diphospho)-2-C-methyl-D-erythritol kinase [Chloroflexi bacterium]|nr:4-(cytidine 5'-diphospho)-2-C-methyl-D-erythritol kinase [Chloroflexota bacterium]
MIRALAHAKVNLCLEVLGRREDGYHEVATVLQALSLADELSVEPADGLSLVCDEPSLAGPDNLVLQAAESLRRETGVSRQVGTRITLIKRIPIAAGLGGGSADAAAALLALDRFWGTHLALADLARLGASIGSDVPFFLAGAGTALAEGRGARVTPLRPLPHAWAVLLLPPLPVPERKTARLYGMLRPEHHTDGCRARRWRDCVNEGSSWPALLEEPGVGNVFETVMAQAYPGIQEAREAFGAIAGPSGVHLAGSGPALFALYLDGLSARRAQAWLVARGFRATLAETAPQPVDLER